MGIYTSASCRPSCSEEVKAYNFLLEQNAVHYFPEYKPFHIDKGLVCLQPRKKKHNFMWDRSLELGAKSSEWYAYLFLCLFLNEDDFAPNEYLKKFYECISYREGWVNVYNDLQESIKLINKIVATSDFFDHTLHFELKYDYPENGSFNVPWDCIEFEEDRVYLYHPNHRNDDFYLPYYYPNIKIDCNVQEVIPEEIKSKWIFSAKCINGKIVYATTYTDFSSLIKSTILPPQEPEEEIDNSDKYSTEAIDRCVDEYKRSKTYSHSDPIKIKDSCYYKYLASAQCDEIPFRFGLEIKINSSSKHLIYQEKAILFTIRDNGYRSVVVYENSNPARSTYIFVVQSSKLTEVSESIMSFFSSNTTNKREKIMYGDIDFEKIGVSDYTRIMHDYYEQWKHDIVYYAKCMMK